MCETELNESVKQDSLLLFFHKGKVYLLAGPTIASEFAVNVRPGTSLALLYVSKILARAEITKSTQWLSAKKRKRGDFILKSALVW